ncbi:MAG: LacI family DNA-binding transcriptional regulator [Thermomicrobiales bacterium]
MVRKRRPTQIDIARAAGVSPAVVSLVINDRANGKIRISSQTQDRVWQVVRDLDYVPNLAARQLAGGRNHLLGVFTFDSAFPVDYNNFYYPFLVGIEQMAETLRYDLMLFTRTSGEDGSRRIYRDGTNALQVADGSILLGGTDDRAELSRLKSDGYPFVYVGRRELDGEQLTYVGADYVSASTEIVEYVASHGHTRSLLMGPSCRNESSHDREQGFRVGLERLGRRDTDDSIVRIDHEIPGEQLEAWLDDGITAFIAESVTTAFRLIELGKVLGKSVPADFSVAALGNTGNASDDVPWITTFQIPRREMGAGAVQLLHQILSNPANPPNLQQFLACRLQPGETVGPVRS